MKNQGEVRALISMMDDPDERIFAPVRNRLMELGSDVVPDLEQAYKEEDMNDLFRGRIEQILHDKHLAAIHQRLQTWAETEEQDLLEGALIICKYRYEKLDEDRVKFQLANFRREIAQRMKEGLTPYEKVRIMNYVIFHKLKFQGDKDGYGKPQNNYLNAVIDGRKGNPSSLGLLYLLLANSLHIPLRGVNLPNHFILAYMTEIESGLVDNITVLFYVNAFAKGDTLSREEVTEFLDKTKMPRKPSFYLPRQNVEIIRRMLFNLMISYEKQYDYDRVKELEALRDLLDKYIEGE